MTILITLGAVFTLILGFSISGLMVVSKLQTQSRLIKGLAFVLLGNVISVFVMALTIFIIWPTQII